MITFWACLPLLHSDGILTFGTLFIIHILHVYTSGSSAKCQMSEPVVPFVLGRMTITTTHHQLGGTKLSHKGWNPAVIVYYLVNIKNVRMPLSLCLKPVIAHLVVIIPNFICISWCTLKIFQYLRYRHCWLKNHGELNTPIWSKHVERKPS